jgi:cobalt-precorrin-5B (C1)-methyltransferase
MFALPDHAMLDMGDFSGGLLKYLRNHPVPRVTIGGGVGKITKLAQGAVDLHSSRSQVDFEALNVVAARLALVDVSGANTALDAIEIAGRGLAQEIAVIAKSVVESQLKGSDIAIDIVVVDRAGAVLGHAF